MQQLSRSLSQALRAAAQRVGAPSGTGVAQQELAGSAAGRAMSRWFSASIGESSAAAEAAAAGSAAATARPNPLTLHQLRKADMRPQNSGRNAFRRMWAKRLQIKWNAQEHAANRKAARQRQHQKRLEQFKQRAEWARERQQQQAALEAAA